MAAIIEKLLVAVVLDKRNLLSRKIEADLAFTALSIFLAFTGVLLLVLSVVGFLEEIYAPYIAYLATAAVTLAAAMTIAFVHRGKPPSSAEADHGVLEKNIHILLKCLYEELEGPIQSKPKMSVLLAAIAGFITAQSQTR